MKKQNLYTLLLLSLLISWQQDLEASEKPAVCTITLNQLIVGFCDDNGTGTDPSDDSTSAMFNVTAVDGAASGYNLDVDGVNMGSYSYDQTHTIFDLPTDITVTLTFTDNDDPSCIVQGELSQASCSGQCVMTISELVAGPCDDNGTPADSSDDTFSASFNITAINGSVAGYNAEVDGVPAGNYTYNQTHTIWGLPTNTDVTLSFQDYNDLSCFQAAFISQQSCSNQCELIVQAAAGPCNDNGTPTDPADDTFDISISASVLNGCGNYVLYQGGNLLGTYAYNTEVVLPGYPADSSTISFLALDACNATCSSNFSITAPGPCSNACIPNVMMETQNSDLYIDNFCYGVIMKAPNGNCYRYKAGNDGTLESELVPCPE